MAGIGGVFILWITHMEIAMPLPIDSLVADLVAKLDDNLREDFEERAGIMEYEAKLPRAHAECLALLDVLHRHPNTLCEVTVLEVELDGETQWLLTTDLDYARQRLADMGGVVVGVLNPAEVVEEQYDGLSMLSTFG